jgi:hypothetical protein
MWAAVENWRPSCGYLGEWKRFRPTAAPTSATAFWFGAWAAAMLLSDSSAFRDANSFMIVLGCSQH